MSQVPEVRPTPDEPDPPGDGNGQGWPKLITLVELLVLLDNDSSPATIIVIAGLLLWALYLAGRRK